MGAKLAGKALDPLEGMAQFSIQKTVQNGETSIQILSPSITPMVMHYDYNSGEYRPYLLSEYSDEIGTKVGNQKIITSWVSEGMVWVRHILTGIRSLIGHGKLQGLKWLPIVER